jgi:1-aminocyclopropane-1-carboxylate deaminase/D-cysteine desulfhydrase-like pyridoxal-dependent ACC family enzyme
VNTVANILIHFEAIVIISLSLIKFLAQLIEISSQTGIVLDPVYTLKGVRGMLTELKNNPKRFKGNRILYIHTGLHV